MKVARFFGVLGITLALAAASLVYPYWEKRGAWLDATWQYPKLLLLLLLVPIAWYLGTFAQAFETYAAKNGAWPANASSGVVPTGMSGELKDSVWVAKNTLGGRWNWDRNNYGGIAVISVANLTVSDEQLTAIDAKIDDGDLNTGRLQKISGRFCYILE